MMTNTATDRYRTPRIDRWTGFGLVLLTFVVFLLSRPYVGIVHDARLYIGFALAQLDPNGIGQDLVFAADGQSGYSIYPIVLRELVRALGPSKAAMASALFGLCVWFAAFYGLARCWLGRRLSPPRLGAAILLALSVSHYYGGTGVFKFAEPYATPRVFAESLVILALTMLVVGRSLLWVIGPLLLAAVIHPIMTAPAFAIVLWWAAPSPFARMALIGIGATGCLLALFGGPLLGAEGVPFSRFDPEWRRALNEKQSLVFLRWWYHQDFTRTLLQLVTTVLASTVSTGTPRRVLHASLVVVGAAMLVTFVGADLVGNVLLTQAQPWRATWIIALLAAMSLPLLLHSAWRPEDMASPADGHPLRKAATLLLVLAWVIVEYSVNAGPLAIIAATLWYVPTRWPTVALPPIGIPLIASTVLGTSLFMVGTQAWVTTEVAAGAPDQLLRRSWHYVWMTSVPGAIAILVSVSYLARPVLRFSKRLLAVGLGIALVLLPLMWDSRAAYQQRLEVALDRRVTTLLQRPALERVEAALWPFSDLESWAFLGRPSWGTPLQGIPSVFSRELALTWTSRWRRLRGEGLTPQAEGIQHLVTGSTTWRGETSIRQLCTMGDAPALLVLPPPLRGSDPAEILHLPTPKLLQPAQRGEAWQQIPVWHIIHCADVRSAK